MTYDPWQHAAECTELLIAHLRLPNGKSWWMPADDAIVLDDRLSQAERRAALAHELIHRERGDQHCDDRALDARRERRVTRQAACRLIDVGRLASALAWSQDEYEVADELWVDVTTARERIGALSAAEKEHIERLIRRNEGAA